MSNKWLCEIREAEEQGDTGLREVIPERDYNFYLSECVPYPDPKDPGHRPPRHKLPEACTYEIRKYEGTYRRYGSCSRCGECCRSLTVWMMKGDICKYAYQET